MTDSAGMATTAHPASRSAKPQRWHYVYFLLAGLDLLTVGASLYLSHRLLAMHHHSLVASEAIASVRLLAGAVNAPGNDVFDSHNVKAERQRMATSLPKFEAALADAKDKGEIAPQTVNAVKAALWAMVQEANDIFDMFDAGDARGAGEQMATMDRKYAALNATIAKLEHDLRDGQYAEAAAQQQIEYGIAALVLLMVGGAAFYGHRLARQVRQLDQARIEYTEALEIARNEALAGSQTKANFLAGMSHEIRTPMNGVIGMTELLLDTEINAEQRDYLETLRRCGDNLLTIINDILDFSKIEAGKLQLESSRFNPHILVEEVIELLAVKAHGKNLELTGIVDDAVPGALAGDAGRLTQILINLVGNAIKFTDHGKVAVRVQLVPSDGAAPLLKFDIEDTGIGIAPEVCRRLFAPFTQADGSITRKFGGTGLGLAISKRLCEMMGGAIGIHSVPGQGSVFWFTARVERAADVLPIAEETVSLSGCTILCVDDHGDNLQVLEHQLRQTGARAEYLTSAAAALDRLRQAKQAGQGFDIAIVDYMMPEMDGVELARLIRADADLASLRLVLLSSADVRSLSDEAGKLFAARLNKPVRRGALYRALGQLLASPAANPAPPAARRAAVKRHDDVKVLLVEDNRDNQKIIVRMLEKMGCRVAVAGNGKLALDALQAEPYEIVFMDCQMPEMDGYEATLCYRALSAASPRRVPIIALTANAMEGDREKCLAAGMDDFLTKPIKPDKISDAIERWLSVEL